MDSFAKGQLWIDQEEQLIRIDLIEPEGAPLSGRSAGRRVWVSFSEWERTHWKPAGKLLSSHLMNRMHSYLGIAWPFVPDEEHQCYTLPLEEVRITPYWKLAEAMEVEAEQPSVLDRIAALMASLGMKP